MSHCLTLQSVMFCGVTLFHVKLSDAKVSDDVRVSNVTVFDHVTVRYATTTNFKVPDVTAS